MAKSDEQIQRESNKRIAAAAQKKLPPITERGSGVADWANADASLLFQLVCVVAMENGAVRFGYTRDGGAYSIGIYLGADSQTYYCNEKEGINDKLAGLIDHFKG